MKVIEKQKNSKNCIICGMDNPLGLKAQFYNLENNTVASLFTFKSEHQSYPERTHGGMISALIDELMGRALWLNEKDTYGVTTTMNITFRKPVPFDTPLKARAYITHNSSRFFAAKGEIFDLNDNLLAEGTARYLKLANTVAFGNKCSSDDEMCYLIEDDIKEINFPEIKND